jgi:transposase InsO family protein
MDCHDREVIAWTATTTGISGELIRDLMIACVEQRFGAIRTPHPIQWLSDNGSVYAAAKTIELATALGLVPCFTPIESPESPVSSADITPWDRPRPMASPRHS